MTSIATQTVLESNPSISARSSEGLAIRSFVPSSLEEGSRRIVSNLLETDGSYFVQIMVPGAIPDTLEVRIAGSHLTVQGTFGAAPFEDARYIRHGIPYGEFCDSVSLPMPVDPQAAEADLRFGILTIRLPKAAANRSRLVHIHSANE
jgi:HSP20 family protein